MSQIVSSPITRPEQHLHSRIAARPVPWFLLFWAVLNLLQVAFTALTSDEGYYWFYAQHLQWGYYDHPPMLAFLIKWGSTILPGEAGVRLFNVVLSTAALWLFFSVLPGVYKTDRRTYLVLLSAPLLHYLTFLLFPDGPLLFFSLLFLVLYKRFLIQKNVATALLLGVSLAGMAYAKYHGALLLLFTLLANPRLLKSGYFYLSLMVVTLLFAPHLWWQCNHDFPTLRYHLSGRASEVSFRYVGEYLSQQIVAIGPGLIFVPFVCKAKDIFERTLKFIITGTFLFFLVSSFRTFVHFHWTSIALYPLLYFAVGFYNQPGKKKLLQWLIVPFVVLFFIARLLLMIPLIQRMHVGEDYYHGRKAWAKEIAALADGKPVFLPNNLREASLYSYYSGQTGVTLYNRPEKKSQYELWGCEDSLQGRSVLFVTKYPFAGSIEVVTGMGQKIYHAVIPSFQSYYSDIEIKASFHPTNPSDTVLQATLAIVNRRKQPVSFIASDGKPLASLVCSIEQGKNIIRVDSVQSFSTGDVLLPGGSIQKDVKVLLKDLPKGEYQLYFGIRSGVLPDAWLLEPNTWKKRQ